MNRPAFEWCSVLVTVVHFWFVLGQIMMVNKRKNLTEPWRLRNNGVNQTKDVCFRGFHQMMDDSIISHLCKLGFLPRQRCYIFPQKMKGRASTALFQIIGAMGSGSNYLNPSNRKDWLQCWLYFRAGLAIIWLFFILVWRQSSLYFGLLFFSCLLCGRILSLRPSNKLMQHAV